MSTQREGGRENLQIFHTQLPRSIVTNLLAASIYMDALKVNVHVHVVCLYVHAVCLYVHAVCLYVHAVCLYVHAVCLYVHAVYMYIHAVCMSVCISYLPAMKKYNVFSKSKS